MLLRWGKRIAIVFLICMALLAPIGIFAVISNQQANNAACEEANDVRTVVTRLLSRSKVIAAQNEDYTTAEKKVADDFYTEALSELKTHHC